MKSHTFKLNITPASQEITNDELRERIKDAILSTEIGIFTLKRHVSRTPRKPRTSPTRRLTKTKRSAKNV